MNVKNNGEDEIRLNLGDSFSDSIDNSDSPADGWYHYSDESYNEYDDYEENEDNSYCEDQYEEETSEMKSSKQNKKSKASKKMQPQKKHRGLSIFAHVLLIICALLSAFYLSVLYAPIPALTNLRNMYVQAGMSTLNHKWLVTAIVPGEIIDEVMLAQHESENAQIGVQSNWGSIDVEALPTFANETITSEEAAAAQLAAEEARAEADESVAEEASVDTGLHEGDSYEGPEYGSTDEATFFSMFHELDYDSMMDYLDEHPEVLSNGWSNIKINRSGMNDVGTSIKTTNGHQVLALDAPNGILLLRVYCNNSRGVMAILKDASRLHNEAAGTIGIVGQTVGKITEANGGLLGINGGAFLDDGYGNGGAISGMNVCDGKIVGDRLYSNYKRIELRDDGKMYIVDSATLVYKDTLQASEFKPALIIDSKIVVDDNCGWTAPAPRTVIGQSERLEVMMVIIEGRFADSIGCSVVDIAELLREYDCAQALNLDGGTSSIMYYKGEYITRCSNPDLPSGRTVPTAWVYE